MLSSAWCICWPFACKYNIQLFIFQQIQKLRACHLVYPYRYWTRCGLIVPPYQYIYIDLVLIITEIFMYMTKRLSAAVNQSIFREPTPPKWQVITNCKQHLFGARSHIIVPTMIISVKPTNECLYIWELPYNKWHVSFLLLKFGQ